MVGKVYMATQLSNNMGLTICPKCKGVHTEIETIFDRDIEKLNQRYNQIKKHHQLSQLSLTLGPINSITFKYEDLPGGDD